MCTSQSSLHNLGRSRQPSDYPTAPSSARTTFSSASSSSALSAWRCTLPPPTNAPSCQFRSNSSAALSTTPPTASGTPSTRAYVPQLFDSIAEFQLLTLFLAPMEGPQAKVHGERRRVNVSFCASPRSPIDPLYLFM